jgi:hypothetical protein
MAFNVIAQGPFYKKKHLPDKFLEQFLSSSYVLSVGIIFCHIHNNPEMKKKKKKKGWYRSHNWLIQVVTSPSQLTKSPLSVCLLRSPE